MIFLFCFQVHQSGELEKLLENNGVIPKVEDAASTSTTS